MAEESTTGAIALGLVVAGVGIFAIDYAFSDPGNSFFDQIKNKLSSKGGEPHVLPPGKPTADGHHVLPARRAPAQPPPAHAGPPSSLRAPISRTPGARAPVMPPQMISPATVRRIATQLNAIFGTNFRADGIVTAEMQRTIKSVQQQLGMPQTGFPDARLIAQLARITRDEAKPSVVADATKVISKTFGGPPSTSAASPDEGVRKTQQMLNSYFKSRGRPSDTIDDDGYAGPLTTGAIQKFQRAEGLEATGNADGNTRNLLAKKSQDLHQGVFATEAQRAQESAAAMQAQLQSAFGGISTISHGVDATGVDAGDPSGYAALVGAPPSDSDGGWKSETQDLGQGAQAVIAKIIATETNQNTLKSVSKALSAAGYPKAASAVLASKGGGAATATGFYGGFEPFAYGPWWADSYGPYGQWW
jgi:peptidoglycan hydrolase-like protein with peptidoglycan-binding domain